jgi:putative N6-adenine-specific DNA methylase
LRTWGVQGHTPAMETMMRLSASCAVGIEKVASAELDRLGLGAVSRSVGRVGFESDAKSLAKALVNLRTADRIFLLAGSFKARDFDELFEGFRNIPWERWVGPDDALVIEKAKSIRSKLSAQNAIQSIGQKGAYEKLCGHYKVARMPETGVQVMVRVRIEDDMATVELDLCGMPLSKRGYRKRPTEAPLKETVAAAALFLSGWKRSFPLYDPFCGSGTIPIEAAMYALDMAPGMNRRFSWEAMPEGGAAAVREAQESAKAAVRLDRDILIAGSDMDEAVLQAALANAGLAGVDSRIRFFPARATEAAPFAERGFVITDPPYGKRLGTPAEADYLYASLGAFAKRFKAWELCFVVDREDFGGFAEKRTEAKWKKTKIIDGAETRWLQRSIAPHPSSAR